MGCGWLKTARSPKLGRKMRNGNLFHVKKRNMLIHFQVLFLEWETKYRHEITSTPAISKRASSSMFLSFNLFINVKTFISEICFRFSKKLCRDCVQENLQQTEPCPCQPQLELGTVTYWLKQPKPEKIVNEINAQHGCLCRENSKRLTNHRTVLQLYKLELNGVQRRE